jgi:prepilin-type N-terminal cleavage/methylation domain-containing protein
MGNFRNGICRYNGFTLIELSIVLVIIGLIVGGIMVGRTLIRSAEIKSIGTDIEKFEAARMTFKTKYNCAAGDCSSANSLGIGSNGNGNGYVEHYSSGSEHWNFWVHLGNAGLIAGAYSGSNGPDSGGGGSIDAVAGVNVPAARIPKVGYSVYTPAPFYTTFSAVMGYGLERSVNDTAYLVGGDSPSNQFNTMNGFISPVDAKSIDDKYDDGLANDGNVRVSVGGATYNTTGCTSGATPNYSYAGTDGALCNLQYWFRNF